MNMKKPKIITIDLAKYGGTGTWTGTVNQLPSGGYSNKQVTKSNKSPRRLKAMGGMMKKKKPMGYNIGGMAKKKKVKR